MELEQDNNQAAIDPLDAFVIDSDDHAEIPEEETAPAESATAEDTTEDKPESHGFQKRIDKVTADKHTEKRRADELQAKLDAIEAAKAEKALVAPTLEDHDYDETSYEEARFNHEVEVRLRAKERTQLEQSKAAQEAAKNEEVLANFNAQAAALNKPDYAAKVGAIPELPAGVAATIMTLDDGAAMAYHLAENLDLANSLASMTPQQALMQLGKISATLNNKPEIKLSAAPEPIEPLKSGGSLSKERGPSGATYT